MKNKVYNVLFPIWMLFAMPPFILVILPSNFIIDSLVIVLALKFLKISNIKEIYKKTIFKIWIFGFLADIVGAIVLFASQFVPVKIDFWYENILTPLMWNPFENVLAFIYCVICVFISGLLIYILNKKVTFKNINIKDKLKKKLALILAIVTAPYLFLLPTKIIYNEYFEDLGLIPCIINKKLIFNISKN